MKKVGQIIDRAEQHCKSSGARLTDKRKQVLTGLVKSDRALSAYELIDICKAEFGETLPATSMYRILEFLRSENLAHKLNLTNQYVACAHITCDHGHAASQFLICGQCQKVKEISVSEATTTELRSEIEHAGYQLATSQFEINCMCEECLANAA